MTELDNLRGAAQRGERSLDGCGAAPQSPGLQSCDLIGLCRRVGLHDRAISCGQRAWRGLHPSIHPHNRGLFAFNLGDALGIGLDQPALHIVNRRNRAAHRVNLRQFRDDTGRSLDRILAMELG